MERSQFLQVMRFVAAALVLCTHATFYYHERISEVVAVWHWGEVGVPLFFVISGIVMVASTQTLPANASGARQFALRRIIRIVPLWWVALAVKIVISLARPEVVNHNHFQVDYALKSLFFIPYFNEKHAVVPLHGVGWTLLHEMYFYVLFSTAILLRLKPAAAVSTLIVALWLAGLFVAVDNPYWAVATSAANLQFVLGMAVGSALAHAQRPVAHGLNLRMAFAASAAGLALVLSVAPSSLQVHYVYPVVLAFAAATLLLADAPLPRGVAAVARLGDSSYSLYLFHPFVAPACILALGKLVPGLPAAVHIGLTIVVTIAVAHALHKGVEVPVVRFARDRLLGAPAPRSVQVKPAP